MRARAALNLREIGLADGGVHFRANGADQLLLGHSAIEAAKGAFDLAKVADFLAKLHIAIRDNNIAICDMRKHSFVTCSNWLIGCGLRLRVADAANALAGLPAWSAGLPDRGRASGLPTASDRRKTQAVHKGLQRTSDRFRRAVQIPS